MRKRCGRPSAVVSTGNDERDLVCPSTPTFAALCLALLASEDRVVHLDAALERTLSFEFDNHRSEFLAQAPGRVPLDANLARQLQRGDRVLRLCDEPSRLELVGQWQQRVLERRTSDDRRLPAAAMAKIEASLADDRIISVAARRAREALRPASGNGGPAALLLHAIALLKLRKAQPLAELDRIACHINLRIDCDSANALSTLRQISGCRVEEVG